MVPPLKAWFLQYLPEFHTSPKPDRERNACEARMNASNNKYTGHMSAWSAPDHIHNGGLPTWTFVILVLLEYNQKVVKNELRVVMATLEIQIDLN